MNRSHRLTPRQMASLIDGATISVGECDISGAVPDWTCSEVCANCGNDLGPHHICTECLEVMSGVVYESEESG